MTTRATPIRFLRDGQRHAAPCGCILHLSMSNAPEWVPCPLHGAAPDLLEACRYAEGWAREYEAKNLVSGESAFGKRLRAAITKATP